ncbi:MAG: EamA family transporter [Ginsengibacter sp.]
MKKAFIQLHLAVLFAGFTAILGKLIDLNEGMIVLYRMLLSALVLVPIMLFSREPIKISLRSLLKIFGIGAIVAFHWVTFYGSIKYSNVSVAVVCLSTIGFFTAFLEPLIISRKIDPVEVGLGLFAVVGIYLIFNFYPEYKTGLIFGIVSAIFASIFPILNKIILPDFTSKIVTLYEMVGGFLTLCVLVPVYLTFFPSGNLIPSSADWLWLMILAVICTVVSFIFSLNALKMISAFTANLSYNLEPVYSIILAFLIFKENKFLGSGFYAGFSLIVCAIVLQMLREWKKRKEVKNRKIRALAEVNHLA